MWVVMESITLSPQQNTSICTFGHKNIKVPIWGMFECRYPVLIYLLRLQLEKLHDEEIKGLTLTVTSEGNQLWKLCSQELIVWPIAVTFGLCINVWIQMYRKQVLQQRQFLKLTTWGNYPSSCSLSILLSCSSVQTVTNKIILKSVPGSIFQKNKIK